MALYVPNVAGSSMLMFNEPVSKYGVLVRLKISRRTPICEPRIPHVEGLAEGQIHRPITITTQDIALTALSHRRKTEALSGLVRIGKDVRIGFARVFVGDPVCSPGCRAWPMLQAEVEPVLGGAQVALPCRFQLVGHVRPLTALAGNPVLKRITLETCHPPISALTKPDEPAPQRRPCPKGSSHVKYPLNWWRIS